MIRLALLLLCVCAGAFAQSVNCVNSSATVVTCGVGTVRYGESIRNVSGGTITQNTFNSTTTGYVYLLSTGGLYLGHNGTTGALTLSGVTEVGGILAFPANSTPLYTIPFTSGAPGTLVLAKSQIGNIDLHAFSGVSGAGHSINSAKTIVTIPAGNYVCGSVATALATTATITLGASSAAAGSQFWFSFDCATGGLVVTTNAQVTQANVTVSNISKGASSATGYATSTLPIGYCTAGNTTVDKIDSCVDARTSIRGQTLTAGTGVTLTYTATGAVQVASSGGDSLPSQTGNGYEVLMTDASNPSWTRLSERGKKVIDTVDEFLPTTHQIGSTHAGWGGKNWITYGTSGTPSATNNTSIASQSHPGIAELTSQSTSGNDVGFTDGATSASWVKTIITPQTHTGFYREYIFMTESSIANRRLAFGTSAAAVGSSLGEGLHVVYDTSAMTCTAGDTSPSTANWILVSIDASGDEWCEDTGLAVATSTWYRVMVSGASGTFTLSVAAADGSFSTYQTTVTAHEPTNNMASYMHALTRTAASVKLLVDYAAKYDLVGAR
jgi:hypothetical protein